MQASLRKVVSLYFNEPVSFASATGKIKASRATEAPVVLQVYACPNNDPTCIAAVFPDSFLDPTNTFTSALPGDTNFTVTIDKTFADPNGKTTTTDTVLSFKTFKYTFNFFDDSNAIPSEAGGLDYDPGSQAIFVCGVDPSTSTMLLRKIHLQGGVPQGAVTFSQPDTLNTGGPFCYGLDIYDGTLYASGSYAGRVFAYNDLTVASQVKADTVLLNTTLPMPDDQLDQVQAVAALNKGKELYFAFGNVGAGSMTAGVVKLDAPTQAWSIWLPATNLFSPSKGFTITRGHDAQQNAYIYLSAGDKIFKVRSLDKTIVNTHQLASNLADAQLRTDSKGRLYVANPYNGDALTVYDTSGSQGFKTIATRDGLPMGRFGLTEQGNDVTLYFMNFRDSARIGTTTINF